MGVGLVVVVVVGLSLAVAAAGGSESRLLIAAHDRSACLEKLLCGMEAVKKSERDYALQAILLRTYFAKYPLVVGGFVESEAEGGAGEGADDEVLEAEGDPDDDEEGGSEYGLSLEDIVHKPKPSRKRKPPKAPKPPPAHKKVIFGLTGVPALETVSLSGRRIKPKAKKPTPTPTPDESLISEMNQRQILDRLSRGLRLGRAGKVTCAQIACPHSFSDIHQALEPQRDEEAFAFEKEDQNFADQISALSSQNFPQGGAYSLKKVTALPGLDGFFHSAHTLDAPPPARPKTKKKGTKKPAAPKPTARPLGGKKRKKVKGDVVGTIAPPQKVFNYKPPTVSEEERESGDDEEDDINSTFPIRLVGHPDHDQDVEVKLKPSRPRPQTAYHRPDSDEDDDEEADDYDEEEKYNVPVDYGNESEQDDETSDEDTAPPPKKSESKKSEAKKGGGQKGGGNKGTTVDYFETVSAETRGKGKKKKVKEESGGDSSEEEDDEEERRIDIHSPLYSSLYARDPLNIGGRPMTAPGDIPIEMTSLGMRERFRSNGVYASAQPDLRVRERGGEKGGVVKEGRSPYAPSRPRPTLTPPEQSSGLSLSRLASPFTSLFKLVVDGASGKTTPQTHPHYQNQRPSAFHIANAGPEPEATPTAAPTSAPIPPPALHTPAPRPVGPESSSFKRYSLTKKTKTTA